MSQVTGRVESVNTKGVKLEGHDKWYNYSKFNAPAPLLSDARGRVVVLDLNKDFIQGYRFDGNAPDPAGYAPSQPVSVINMGPTTKDISIVRQTCIKAVADYGKMYNPIEVLQIASLFERWVNRESEDTLEELAADAEQWGFLRRTTPTALRTEGFGTSD